MFLAYFYPPVAWRQIAKQTIAEIGDDHCLGLAAQLAFYFLLALFPALLFVVALIGYLPVENALAELLQTLGTVAPQELVQLLQQQLQQIAHGSEASLLTLGIVGAIWSSSAAMVAIIDALNHAYDVVEWRSWWKRRLLAIGLTVALAVFTLIALGLILVGPDVASVAVGWLGLSPVVTTLWALLRWPAMIVAVIFAMDLVYYFAPNRPTRWAWITPGSLVATAAWLISSFGFKLYVSNFSDYTATYGAIATAIITMLWFYVSGVTILIGAELNAVIEQRIHDTAAPMTSRERAPE
jgi:membrane protein